MHAPGSNSQAVAEHALMLMLMCAKRARQIDRWTRADMSGGFDLLESNDPKALAEFALQWSDLMELTIVPVLDDRQLRLMLGENARRIADGEPPEPLSLPGGAASLVQPLTFARIHQYISMAVPMLWMRQRDGIGALGLAVNASHERDGHEEASERIEELLVAASDLWREGGEVDSDGERVAAMRRAIQLVNLADMIAVTTRA